MPVIKTDFQQIYDTMASEGVHPCEATLDLFEISPHEILNIYLNFVTQDSFPQTLQVCPDFQCDDKLGTQYVDNKNRTHVSYK